MPNSSEIRLAVRRQRPISQLRSKMLWIGKLRLKIKLRQYSICPMACDSQRVGPKFSQAERKQMNRIERFSVTELFHSESCHGVCDLLGA
jgi:hypothetical protein